MYVTIRRYRLAGSGVELLRRIKQEFIPIITAMPGFRGYHAVDCGGAEALSITLWDQKYQAERASIIARDWVSRWAIGLVPFSPERLSGDMVLSVQEPPSMSSSANLDWIADLRHVSAYGTAEM